MSIRIRLESASHATVHIQPTFWDRFFSGATDQDYPVQRITELGSHTWITHDNRPVAPAVADEIEAELQRACVGGRLKTLRT